MLSPALGTWMTSPTHVLKSETPTLIPRRRKRRPRYRKPQTSRFELHRREPGQIGISIDTIQLLRILCIAIAKYTRDQPLHARRFCENDIGTLALNSRTLETHNFRPADFWGTNHLDSTRIIVCAALQWLSGLIKD